MKIIYLSGKDSQKFCKVDDEDYQKLSQYKWYLSHKSYANRNRKIIDGKKDIEPIGMHTFILGKKDGLVIDHINEDKLDNQKSNLRYISNTENIRRRGADKRSTTGYKGVYRFKSKNLKSTTIRYLSHIRVDGRLICLGYFKDKKEAALAYNKASKKYHGDFGFQNTV